MKTQIKASVRFDLAFEKSSLKYNSRRIEQDLQVNFLLQTKVLKQHQWQTVGNCRKLDIKEAEMNLY